MPRIERQGDRTAARLRVWLAEGRLAPGDRLPSERELAAQLKVNRKAVHAVLDQLVREGAIAEVSPRIRTVARRTQAGPGPGACSLVLVTRAATEVSYHREPMTMAVMAAAQRHGWQTLAVAPAALDADGVRRLIATRPGGVLLLSDALRHPFGQGAAMALAQAGLAVAAYSDALPAGDESALPFDRIASDHAMGGRILARWCLKQGRLRLLRFWNTARMRGPVPHWLAERDRGIDEACREAGVALVDGPVPIELPVGGGDPDPLAIEQGIRACVGFLHGHLTGTDAILCRSDRDALYVAAACRLLGRHPHHDMLVCGYDNQWSSYPELAQSVKPAATVEKDLAAITEAMLACIGLRAESRGEAPRRRLISPRLVVLG